MENLLNYPQSTIVNRVVPKTMFYKYMEVNAGMKTRFLNDVVNIVWLYKLSASTLNVTDREDMKEIEVFVVNLKQPDCPTELFSFIDINMPHHIVFVLVHDGHAMLLINYKEWTDGTHVKFRINQSFVSPWRTLDALSLSIQGQSLPRIYDNFVAQVSGIGEHKSGAMSEIVNLQKQKDAVETELQTLQKRMRRELQYDVQMKINKQVKAKRKELAEIEQKIESLK